MGIDIRAVGSGERFNGGVLRMVRPILAKTMPHADVPVLRENRYATLYGEDRDEYPVVFAESSLLWALSTTDGEVVSSAEAHRIAEELLEGDWRSDPEFANCDQTEAELIAEFGGFCRRAAQDGGFMTW